MTTREKLNAIVEEKNLLNHPFYQAWSDGTLPVDALKTYAEEYGAFIKTIGDGWRAHGDTEIGVEEDEHAALWGKFAAALGTEISEAKVEEVKVLVDAANSCFSNEVESMGGLYAFEAQQPHTSTSKLKGLQEHYGTLGADAEEYFDIHCDDIHEMELLAQRIEKLDAEGQDKAVAACRQVADALWDALTGISKKHGVDVAHC